MGRTKSFVTTTRLDPQQVGAVIKFMRENNLQIRSMSQIIQWSLQLLYEKIGTKVSVEESWKLIGSMGIQMQETQQAKVLFEKEVINELSDLDDIPWFNNPDLLPPDDSTS